MPPTKWGASSFRDLAASRSRNGPAHHGTRIGQHALRVIAAKCGARVAGRAPVTRVGVACRRNHRRRTQNRRTRYERYAELVGGTVSVAMTTRRVAARVARRAVPNQVRVRAGSARIVRLRIRRCNAYVATTITRLHGRRGSVVAACVIRLHRRHRPGCAVFPSTGVPSISVGMSGGHRPGCAVRCASLWLRRGRRLGGSAVGDTEQKGNERPTLGFQLHLPAHDKSSGHANAPTL